LEELEEEQVERDFEECEEEGVDECFDDFFEEEEITSEG
jgi:hypothetical protein